MAIWTSQNKLIFEKVHLSLVIYFGFVLNSMREASLFKIGLMQTNVNDLLILQNLGLQGIPSKAPKVRHATWLAP